MDVPNLQVIKACQSLNSRGLIKTQYSWQHYYYTLTNDGIEYLREYLHLPSEIVPATFKKALKAAPLRPARPADDRRSANRSDRDDYRKKESGPGGEYRPEFRGGFGRGGPRE